MLTLVKLSGPYFCNAGGPFIPTGVNWVPARAAMQWPFEWDPEAVEQDFARMQAMHINLVRFDLVWQWVEPRPGQYNPRAFEQFDFLIELAHRYEIYLNPALFAGGEVGDAWWEIPWRQGRHPHADADMLFWQARHVEQFARRYRGESAILAWDLTDEPPYWVVMKPGQTSDAMAAVWTQLLTDSLRRYDPEHLVMVGASNMELSRGPFRADVIAPWVDFLSVHPYPLYNQSYYPEPILSTRGSYSPAFETALAGSIGKPVLMQEFGSTSAQCGLDVQARYYNVFMHSALAAGNMGLVAWTFTDADPVTQYRRAPYKRNPHETQFGATASDGTPRPQGEELQRMGATLRRLDLSDLAPELPQVGILAPHEWAQGLDFNEYGFPPDALYQYVPRDDVLHHATDSAAQEQLVQAWLSTYILSRQAGFPVSFPRENDDWQTLKLILAPYPLTGSSGVYFSYHLYTTFWYQARDYVASGGTLYASLNANAAIPRELARDLCGLTLVDRARWQEDVILTFTEAFGNISSGQTLHLPAFPGVDATGVLVQNVSAQVLAVDQDGQAAIFLHPYGKGRCVISTYPLELLLGKTYGAFENVRPEVDLYRALGALAGVEPACRVDDPAVSSGVLRGSGRDVVILVNHTAQSRTVQAVVSASLERLNLLTAQGNLDVAREPHGWTCTLEPFSGAMYEAIYSESSR
ncbi:MAG: cellulase family glycosylhydrolase [Anaerolineae bacterium]|nr:cellulase family glycosylhydrolase [Anaerolineae bacterium]